MSIDLASIGRELKKPVENIETAVKLLDEGNTIPFITRFRKDQTGGLSEDQLSTIKASVARLRSLAERKTFIAKSIDSQGKLNDQLRAQIEAANSTRELEDVYLPYKPKKQTLATVAKQNGLEPLAMDVFEGREPEKDLASRATDFVRVDKNLNTVDEVIAGVKHILAEKFSDNPVLRSDLRGIISNGKLTTRLIESVSDESDTVAAPKTQQPAPESDSPAVNPANAVETPIRGNSPDGETSVPSIVGTAEGSAPVQGTPEVGSEMAPATPEPSTDDHGKESTGEVASPTSAPETCPAESTSSETATLQEASPVVVNAVKKTKPKKKKKKKKTEDPYKEFHDFSHPVAKMQYHKTLAINRGEKNGRLKVKIQYDEGEILSRAFGQLVPDDHPFKDFLCECVKDGISRLVAPSLERETRREITEAAEKHAVEVFARNLKNLMLQSPVRDHLVLAIDPGYKRGCSLAVLDHNGQLLADAHVFVVGNEKRRVESRERLVELIKTHKVTLIAIGNGAACREAEQMISDMLVENFADSGLKYSMVNEAGASFYSTSEVGREEFPDLSPAIRSAISIGRRLIDPLSELVKISPANIGVGLYQHDVKAKHLADSLDDVVQFCVNRVGVDVNTASPSLLKYVSGLNQLTARRLYEYREEKGAFKNREQLKEVSGYGDATFVQSAGFLRIRRGDQPLDTTGVHPEHYGTALKIIEKVDASINELFPIASSTSKSDEKSLIAEGVQPASESVELEGSAAASAAVDEKTELNLAGEGQVVAESNLDTQTDPSDTTTEQTAAAVTEDKSEDVRAEKSVEVVVASPNAKSPPAPELTAAQIQRRKEIVKSIRELDVHQLATEMGVGRFLMQDIVHSICRPEYDPRNNVNRPVFRSGIIKIDDLTNEMQLEAQVVNVVDFGVFVDIGLGTSCLVHVSQLANHFIRDPHRFYAVGDSLRVWVTDVDKEQRRVKLTAVQPKSSRPPRKTTRKGGKSFSRPNDKRGGQGSRGGQGYKGGQGGRNQYKQKHKAKPKPVKPITEDMITGAEPMRSFSDLAQFFTKQSDKKDDGKP